MKNNQSGNVLFYILIAVALLAALSFAVATSGRGNMSEVTDEKAKIIASEILDYANIVTNAVAQLRLRGAKETDLCFDDPQWPVAYNNPSCSDDATKIFHTSGGGITWAKVATEAADLTASPDYLWHIYGDNEIQDVGLTCGDASCAELILVTDELRQAVCIKINDLLGINNPGDVPPTDTDIGETQFIGTYGYSYTIGDEAGGAALRGKMSGCFQKTGGTPEYIFYKVLQAR